METFYIRTIRRVIERLALRGAAACRCGCDARLRS
jgi:hypothetical protein